MRSNDSQLSLHSARNAHEMSMNSKFSQPQNCNMEIESASLQSNNDLNHLVRRSSKLLRSHAPLPATGINIVEAQPRLNEVKHRNHAQTQDGK